MDRGLFHRDAGDVDHYDGGDDGAIRDSNGSHLCCRRPEGGSRRDPAAAPTGIFVIGYVVIWSLFSLGATIAQWALDCMALLSPMMMSNSPILGGLLLLTTRMYPADTRQRRLPAALPLSGGLPFLALETGRHGRLWDGHRTRCLLPRVLLDPNGTALLRRGDELVVDKSECSASSSSWKK